MLVLVGWDGLIYGNLINISLLLLYSLDTKVANEITKSFSCFKPY
jgi:hypothetical protein